MHLRTFVKFLLCFLLGCSNYPSEGFDPSDGAINDASSDTFVPIPIDAGLDGSLPYGIFDTGYPNTDTILYLGGKVSTDPINVYYIWYGNWTDNTPVVLEDLIQNISDNPWYQIAGLYYQKNQKIKGVNNGDLITPTSILVNFKGSVYIDSSIYGTTLTQANIISIVSDQIKINGLDSNGLYYVLTSQEINQADNLIGFCDIYCGWHTSYSDNSQQVKIAFVGDVSKCPDSCSVQTEFLKYGITVSPNNNWTADGMASVILHELSEVATDPYPVIKTAWADQDGNEIADKCAWTFGQPYLTSTSAANVKIGSRDYIIQQNWVKQSDGGGYCGLQP